MEPLKEQDGEPGKFTEPEMTPEQIHQAIYRAEKKCELAGARAKVRAMLKIKGIKDL